jgi:hypothetical protein
MSDWETSRRLNQVAQRWRQLAEQRRVAFVKLYDSGDWKRSYTEADFRLRMREVVASAKRWNEIAASSTKEPAAPATAEADSKPRHRTAA